MTEKKNQEAVTAKKVLNINRVPDKTGKRKLKLANFAFNYKFESFANLAIAFMVTENISEKNYDLYADHPGFIFPKINDNYSISSTLKSLVFEQMIADNKSKYIDLIWSLSDYSPSSIIWLSQNKEAFFNLFWRHYNFTKPEMINLYKKVFKKEIENKTIDEKAINEIIDKIFSNVRIVESVDDVRKILAPSLTDVEEILNSPDLKDVKNKPSPPDPEKHSSILEYYSDKLKNEKLDPLVKKKFQEEVNHIVFDNPPFFYLFLFNNPHSGNVKWEEILAESEILHKDKIDLVSCYVLTSILIYHEEHYKVIVIHDTPILIMPECNTKDPILPSDDVVVIGLLYSHMSKVPSTNTYNGMFQIVLPPKNSQRESYSQEYLDAIKYYFKSIHDNIKDDKIDGFDLIENYIRFPAFYCYELIDEQLIDDVIKYDVYSRGDKVLKSQLGFFIIKHALITLWVISVTKFLEKMEECYLRCSLLYIVDIEFIKKFTFYLKKEHDKKKGENDILNKAFSITFEDESSKTESKKEYNYNEIFPTLEFQRTDREQIIYNFTKQIKLFVNDKFQDGNEKEKKRKMDEEVKNVKDYCMTQDFLEYQKTKVRTHPYLQDDQ